MRKSSIGIVFLVICSLGVAQETLNNDGVIKLVKAGLSDDLIVTTINAAPGKYDTSANALFALRSAGADSKVIAAVLMKSSGATPAAAVPAPAALTPARAAAPAASAPAPPAAAPTGPPPSIVGVGVYYKDLNGAWKPVLPEIVDFKSGGVIKNIASADVVKKDINGRIQGAHSRVNAAFPVELAVYVPEGTEITDYELLRLHESRDSREFRSVTGGVRVLHASGSASRDLIEFQTVRLAPGVYKITLESGLGTGEYGLLPPMAEGSSNAGSSGKIYAVSVLE